MGDAIFYSLIFFLYRLFIVSVSSTCKMHDDFYFSNNSWCQLAGMDVRSYNLMEAIFIQMIDFDFNVTEAYYNKYCQSLYGFIQNMQRQLRHSYDQILRIANVAEDHEEVPGVTCA